MRLHDVQVTLSAADIANRYQVQHQQTAAAAQAQEAINLNAQAEIKKTQTQAQAGEPAAKEITEEEKRMKRWAKGRQKENKENEETGGGSREKNLPGEGHIIDIKA